MRYDDLYLVDIIEAYGAVARMMGAATSDEFTANETLASAVQLKLVVMGEALSSMSDLTRDMFVDVPVRQVRNPRNRIVHGYFSIDDRLIYEIAVEHAPGLAAEAERALTALFPETHRRMQQRRGKG